jgi:hypothetical protein
VAPVAVTVAVAVRGMAVAVAVRGVAIVAIPALRAITVAVVIGGGLGGGEASCAERAGRDDRNEGCLKAFMFISLGWVDVWLSIS